MIMEPDPFKLSVDVFLEFRRVVKFVQTNGVPQAQSFVGGKERLIDWHKVLVDYQTVEAHQTVDGELPLLAHCTARV